MAWRNDPVDQGAQALRLAALPSPEARQQALATEREAKRQEEQAFLTRVAQARATWARGQTVHVNPIQSWDELYAASSAAARERKQAALDEQAQSPHALANTSGAFGGLKMTPAQHEVWKKGYFEGSQHQ